RHCRATPMGSRLPRYVRVSPQPTPCSKFGRGDSTPTLTHAALNNTASQTPRPVSCCIRLSTSLGCPHGHITGHSRSHVPSLIWRAQTRSRSHTLPKRSNTGVVCPAIPDPDAANPWVTRHASLVQSLLQAQKRRPSSAIFLADGRSPESAIVPSLRQVRRPVLTPATAGFLRRRPFVSLLFRARLASAPRGLKCRFNRA
ncbi:MAG: hypothetical protein RJA63_3546, partial [Pseudomonadota bacterium]